MARKRKSQRRRNPIFAIPAIAWAAGGAAALLGMTSASKPIPYPPPMPPNGPPQSPPAIHPLLRDVYPSLPPSRWPVPPKVVGPIRPYLTRKYFVSGDANGLKAERDAVARVSGGTNSGQTTKFVL